MQKKIKETYLARFDHLIAEGEKIIKNTHKGLSAFGSSVDCVDDNAANAWRTNCFSLLSQIKPNDDFSFVSINSPMEGYEMKKERVEKILSFIRAIKDDFQQGFIESLSEQIEATLICDYMGMAKNLLNDSEAKNSRTDHIPAAVLAGATLEHALRTLCERNGISIQKDNGDFKTLNPLIDGLKAANIFNELKAKQLRAWADIRNFAAHGRFTEFSREDVSGMITNIDSFLADFM